MSGENPTFAPICPNAICLELAPSRASIERPELKIRASIGHRDCKMHLLWFEERFLVLTEALAVDECERT